jgi:hypothetical protein
MISSSKSKTPGPMKKEPKITNIIKITSDDKKNFTFLLNVIRMP